MREHGGDIRFICLEAQTWAMKESISNLFITHLGHRHCLTTSGSGVGTTTYHICCGMSPEGGKIINFILKLYPCLPKENNERKL